jgi:hypothetical protein
MISFNNFRKETDVVAETYRVHATSKTGENFTSGKHDSKKSATDLHYKMSKSGLYKEIEVKKDLKEEEDLDEAVDKSSDVYKQYVELKKKSIKELRDMIKLSRKVVDVSGYDKEGAISDILRDRHGNKKVAAAMSLDEAGPKIKQDNIKAIRAADNAHDNAMGRTSTGRKKSFPAMTSTQKSLASMRKEEAQLDEISNKVKASYLDKGVQQAYDRFLEPFDPKKEPKWATPKGNPKKGYYDQPSKVAANAKAVRRGDIIDKTSMKLTGRPHFSQMSTKTTPSVTGNVNDWWKGKKYSTEEVELAEIKVKNSEAGFKLETEISNLQKRILKLTPLAMKDDGSNMKLVSAKKSLKQKQDSLKSLMRESAHLNENPMEEKPMMMGALRTMSHNLTGIAKYIEKTSDPEEWFQNKLAAAASELQTLYGYATAETMEMDDPKEYSESEVRQALSDYFISENYSINQINNLDEEEINEIIGKMLGGAAKLAAKGAYRAVVNKQGNSRFSSAGKADSAEAKANAAEKKNKNRDRIKAARDRLSAAQAAARS